MSVTAQPEARDALYEFELDFNSRRGTIIPNDEAILREVGGMGEEILLNGGSFQFSVFGVQRMGSVSRESGRKAFWYFDKLNH